MSKTTKTDRPETPEIESVEFIYSGKDSDFVAFLKAVFSDYLSEDRAADIKKEGERENEK